MPDGSTIGEAAEYAIRRSLVPLCISSINSTISSLKWAAIQQMRLQLRDAFNAVPRKMVGTIRGLDSFERGTNPKATAFGFPLNNGGNASMKKFVLSAVIAFVATSALAQAVVHEEYYVVRDPATKKCTIVDQKPTVTTTIVDHGIFKTRSEAETGMKTMKVCTDVHGD